MTWWFVVVAYGTDGRFRGYLDCWERTEDSVLTFVKANASRWRLEDTALATMDEHKDQFDGVRLTVEQRLI